MLESWGIINAGVLAEAPPAEQLPPEAAAALDGAGLGSHASGAAVSGAAASAGAAAGWWSAGLLHRMFEFKPVSVDEALAAVTWAGGAASLQGAARDAARQTK